jgi:hypothetical protein
MWLTEEQKWNLIIEAENAIPQGELVDWDAFIDAYGNAICRMTYEVKLDTEEVEEVLGQCPED